MVPTRRKNNLPNDLLDYLIVSLLIEHPLEQTSHSQQIQLQYVIYYSLDVGLCGDWISIIYIPTITLNLYITIIALILY